MPNSVASAIDGAKTRLVQALEYPATASLSVDSPQTTIQRWQIIRDKPPLHQIYDEWYTAVARALPAGEEPVLELGSGAGFMSSYVTNLITTDILDLPGLGRVMNACVTWPFPDDSLRGVAMVNTLHHLPDVTAFFREAVRCLAPGGVISMIEPWNTRWSRFVYGRLHPEPFDAHADSWTFQSDGPLSDANVALPWILFERDRTRFHREFPDLEIRQVRLIMPFRYLLSGGVSMRALVPQRSFGLIRRVEQACQPVMGSLAMFAHITLGRR